MISRVFILFTIIALAAAAAATSSVAPTSSAAASSVAPPTSSTLYLRSAHPNREVNECIAISASPPCCKFSDNPDGQSDSTDSYQALPLMGPDANTFELWYVAWLNRRYRLVAHNFVCSDYIEQAVCCTRDGLNDGAAFGLYADFAPTFDSGYKRKRRP